MKTRTPSGSSTTAGDEFETSNRMKPSTIPMITPIPMPRRKPAKFMTRQEVIKLCKRNKLGERSAETLFFGHECSARIVLPGRTYAVYHRAVVFDVLGLNDEESP